MRKIPEDLYYTEEHEWVKIEGDIATVGITDFAQNSLGDIVFVELPDLESNLEKGETFGVVESIKSVSDLFVPVNGQVIEKNDDIEETPENVNKDAYNAWFIKLKMEDASQIKNLLKADKYKEFCESN